MAAQVTLDTFLKADDLDEALHAAHQLPELTEADITKITTILTEKWETERQAVANLLQNAQLIPEAIRIPTLFKALSDPFPYYVLAATVGFQERPTSTEDKQKLKAALIASIHAHTGPIASRAWTTIQSDLKFPEDGSVVVSFFTTHKDKAILGNARDWIVEVFQEKPEDELKAFLEVHKVPQRAQTIVVSKWKDHIEKKKSGSFSWLGGGLSYIPNLNEYGRMQALRMYLSSVFEMYDEDQDGFLNKDDMLKFFARIGAKPIVEDPTKLAKAFKDGDEFDTGVIDVADFVQMMSGKLSVPDHVLAEFGDLSLSPSPANAGEDDEATFKDIFNTFDFDKDGFLGVDDLKKALLVLGANLSADEVATIFAAGDKDKDGKLNFTEFKDMMMNGV